MTYSPFLIVHICAGFVAILSGAAALIARKGSPMHRSAGKTFVISMLVMSSSGGYMAWLKSQPGNVFGGVITFYLVASAWLTVARREKETGLLEYGLLLVAFAMGVTGMMFGWEAAHSATGLKDGDPAAAFFVFGSVGLLSAAGDVRMIARHGLAGARRILRHVWRMCLALFIAAVSFFLGTSSNPLQLRARLFSAAVRRTHLPDVPVVMVVVLTIFWLWRVRFTNLYKNAEQ